jgi:hypothetical protein
MTVCLAEKEYVTRGLARVWHKLSRGDNPSYHTLTRFIIVLLHRISYTVPYYITWQFHSPLWNFKYIDVLNMSHHLVSVVRYELDQIIMALCMVFDVTNSRYLYEYVITSIVQFAKCQLTVSIARPYTNYANITNGYSCVSNYHTIMTTMAPLYTEIIVHLVVYLTTIQSWLRWPPYIQR